MSEQDSRALPVVAWAYAEERFGRSIVRLSAEPCNGAKALVLASDAQAAIDGLRAEVEKLRALLTDAADTIEGMAGLDLSCDPDVDVSEYRLAARQPGASGEVG